MSHKKIHAEIKKHAPKAFHSSKKKFGFKCPKLCLLALSIFLAYILFRNPFFHSLISSFLYVDNYFGAFLAGVLVSFGFTSAFGIGLLFNIHLSNIFLAAILGGVGAMVSDLIIFSTIKSFFKEEFDELERTEVIKKIESIVKGHRHVLLRHYFLYALAGIMIASPFPDELGVSMLAGLTTIKPSVMAVVSFALHTLAILLILLMI